MTECNQNQLKEQCGCSYSSCSRRGKCCECLQYHLAKNELPGCAFARISTEAERTYDRSFTHFARLINK
ncbi:MAG: DUF6485 family protein [Promethearchaeota archaeon]